MTSAGFTYPEVGATRTRPLPAGYHHVRMRARVGSGRETWTVVADGLMSWSVHRGSGLDVTATADRAAAGVQVTTSIGLGPLRLRNPCEVVWTADDDARAGFAYGTLRGHPASGEESFIVELDPDGDVWFTVTAFSRPAAWYAKLGGPVTRSAQRVVTRRYLSAALRIAESLGEGPGQ